MLEQLWLVPQALLGFCVFLLLARLCGEKASKVHWRPVLLALCVQVLIALAALHVEPVRAAFLWVGAGINTIKDATQVGTSFVFGYLGGAPLPFEPTGEASSFIFAWAALPMVMVVSALSMLLFHWRILPLLVHGFSWIFKHTLGVGGALGLCAAAKVFLGMTEAPLLIRPYLSKLTRSELFAVMALGMATTSASVMMIYATILEGTVLSPISHILTASLIAVPGAVAVARLMVPQHEPDTEGTLLSPYSFAGPMEAISRGAQDGLNLFLQIIAMLVVMLALVALVNITLGHIVLTGNQPLSLQLILGWLLSPVAWLMGIPWSEATVAGHLLGTKIVLNEMMAFIDMTKLQPDALQPTTKLILTYALCGFANLGSVGIQIASMSTMVPERREEIIAFGFRALFAGTLASCMSATLVGILSRFV